MLVMGLEGLASSDAATPAGALRLLGAFDLTCGAVRVAPAPGERRLLALLGLHRSPVSRTYVSRILWPGAAAARAAARLRSAVYRVRRLHPAIVGTDAGGMLGLHGRVAVDARILEAAAAGALAGEAGGVETLAASAAELLPGWDEDWVLFHRERLRQLRLQALEEACRQLVAGRRPAEAVAAGRAAVEAAPLRESARRALMRAYAAAGRSGDAAAEYEDYRRELHSRLAVAPSAAMEKLVAALGLIGPSRRGDAVVTDPR